MQPIGYLYKNVVARPDWLNALQVVDVYSLSGCVSNNFADYINYWKHNGFWLFDSPQAIRDLASDNSLELEGMKLFYYEAYELEHDENNGWVEYTPEGSFETDVIEPNVKQLEGFDVASFTVRTSPECSPLSCNSLAATLRANSHCLFATFDEAKKAIEEDKFHDSEPGPYRIIAVYSVHEP